MRYHKNRRCLMMLLTLVILLSCQSLTFASLGDVDVVNQRINQTASYMLKMTPNLNVGSIGGEWTAMGLARSDYDVPNDFFERYYHNVEVYVKQKHGILHTKKYTEYSRLILALTAIGKNPQNVAGYDLIKPLGDFNRVIKQGINGPIFALIALDSGDYAMPTCQNAEAQATRDMYIDYILEKQIASDSGFSLAGDKGDPDVTAMALQALAKYQNRQDVKRATQKALEFLSVVQEESGGYKSWGVTNSESVAQVIVALTALDIDPDDKRFVKNGHSLIQNLLSFYDSSGGFLHIKAGQTSNGGAAAGAVDGMATDQSFYAMIAYRNFYQKKPHVYDMTAVLKKDVVDEGNRKLQTIVLGDAVIPNVIYPDKTFNDIKNSPYSSAISEMASRGIVNGMNEDTFKPNKNMTRAEFCTMIVRSMGLKNKDRTMTFTDVKPSEWYYEPVKIAYENHLINGRDKKTFAPAGIITRQEAAMMLYNSASILGLNQTVSMTERNTYLPGYLDFVDIPDWSKDALTFSIKHNMIDNNRSKLQPNQYITRAELTFMTYQLLVAAGL